MAKSNRAEPRTLRPTIPHATKLEVWARAAGRCEFRGCNAPLYQDTLTRHRSILGQVSHIVACRPDGPRGDPLRSRSLATDIDNLILTCRDHGKVIDDHGRVAEYPEERLRAFKREHEDRIRILTSIGPEARTHVLVVEAALRDRTVRISDSDAFRAIIPSYPADERASRVDLSEWPHPRGNIAKWQAMADEAGRRVLDATQRWDRTADITSISVFALAPIPLLVHLGRVLGDIRRVEAYQRHRATQDWRWPETEESESFFRLEGPRPLEAHNPALLAPSSAQPSDESNRGALDIAVVLSVSGRVDAGALVRTPFPRVAEGLPVYELVAETPGLDFLRSRVQISRFASALRRLLAMIRGRHGHGHVLHLVAAVPAPMAIEFGRSLKAIDAPVLVYDFDDTAGGYIPVLTVNQPTAH